MALLGLDIGTTGCKCAIYTAGGTLLATSYREYPVKSPSPGYFELDPDLVWESVKAVIKESTSKAPADPVLAISVSSLGEAVIPLNSEGKVLADSILYTDVRGGPQCDRLIDRLGLEKIMSCAGLRAQGMYSICRMMWYRDNAPEIFAHTYKFLLFEDFILFRLGKCTVTDYSLASRTMAFDPRAKKWSSEILSAADIPEALLPTAVISGTRVGTVLPDVAAELGLHRGCALVTGGHDQVCSALGGGIVRSEMAINAMGTVDCITPCFDVSPDPAAMMDNNYSITPYIAEGSMVTYAYNLTGGATVKWFRDSFAHEAAREAREKGTSVYALLDARMPAGPTGLLLLPHFAGAGTPYMDSSAKGALIGLTLNTTPEEIYKSILEGVCFESRLNLERLQSVGINISTLRTVGGGARSEAWLQLKADITGKTVETIENDEAGTVGTAMLAGVAAGELSSLEAAAEIFIRVKKTYRPDPEKYRIYSEKYQKYSKLYRSVKDLS